MAVNGEHVALDLGDNTESWKGDGQTRQSSYTLGERVGLDELLSGNVLRASLAELLGTAVLIFMIDTIVISIHETHYIAMPNLISAILTGITVTVLILALFPVSGGHLNPIITLSATLTGLISLSRALMYILAQCAGGILGALALQAVVSSTIGNTYSLGGCTIRVITPGPDGPVTTGIRMTQAFWLETFCTFCLMFIAVWVAFNPHLMKSLGLVVAFSIIGIVVALLAFLSTTITGQKGYAGAAMNPARCLGAALVKGGHLWDGHWIFWVAPTIACFAFYSYTKLISDQDFRAQYHKYEFFGVINALIRTRHAH